MGISVELETAKFDVGEFLVREHGKDLLRFSTAGSVDDGKSTLIGRLLYDTRSVYEDQLRSIEGKGTTAPGQIDFALLTDGLRAEREQGITIDVAYRYFSIAKRKFIIADTPGHEQYTRNMATGASTADAAVVLVDATKGVLIQSRRHAYITSLLRVRHVLVAVNKMDLIGYGETPFRAIEAEFRRVLEQIAADTGNPVEATFVPVSALAGDNVVHHSHKMPWYKGGSLLDLLESLPPARGTAAAAFRFPVQYVLRPDHTFRGFAGQIASGTVRVGDAVTVLPSGRGAKIARIVTWDGDLDEAASPFSATLALDREVDISRGDLIVAAGAPAMVARRLKAAVVWMDQRALELGRRYLLKHTSQTVPAFVTAIEHRANLTTLAHESAVTLQMNDIGVVSVDLLRPVAIDAYGENRATGAFILIDPESNATVAAGMVRETAGVTAMGRYGDDDAASGPVTAGERQSRRGHRGGVLELAGPAELIDAVERSLFSVGAVTSRIEADEDAFLLHPRLLEFVTGVETRSGLLSLVARPREDGNFVARVEGEELKLDVNQPMQAVTAVHQLLYSTGIFISSEYTGL